MQFVCISPGLSTIACTGITLYNDSTKRHYALTVAHVFTPHLIKGVKAEDLLVYRIVGYMSSKEESLPASVSETPSTEKTATDIASQNSASENTTSETKVVPVQKPVHRTQKPIVSNVPFGRVVSMKENTTIDVALIELFTEEEMKQMTGLPVTDKFQCDCGKHTEQGIDEQQAHEEGATEADEEDEENDANLANSLQIKE